MAKTAAVGIRIEPELKAALDRLAAADRRSLAAYVEIVLQDHVRDRSAGQAALAAAAPAEACG